MHRQYPAASRGTAASQRPAPDASVLAITDWRVHALNGALGGGGAPKPATDRWNARGPWCHGIVAYVRSPGRERAHECPAQRSPDAVTARDSQPAIFSANQFSMVRVPRAASNPRPTGQQFFGHNHSTNLSAQRTATSMLKAAFGSNPRRTSRRHTEPSRDANCRGALLSRIS